jgi:hypothetical protein
MLRKTFKKGVNCSVPTLDQTMAMKKRLQNRELLKLYKRDEVVGSKVTEVQQEFASIVPSTADLTQRTLPSSPQKASCGTTFLGALWFILFSYLEDSRR